MYGVTKKDMVRRVRESVKVASVSKKIAEKRLKWYGGVGRRDKGHVLRRMTDTLIPRKRRRGRQKTRWKGSCKRDMESVELKVKDARDRISGIEKSKTIPATSDAGKRPRRRH